MRIFNIKYTMLLPLVVAFLMSACASKEALIEMRQEINNPQTIEENMQEINEILAEKSNDPFFFAEAMKTGLLISNNIDISNTHKNSYNTLIDNYSNISKNNFIENSFISRLENLDEYNAYTKNYAIYCLANIQGTRPPNELIKILYTLSQYDTEKTILLVLKGLQNNMEKIKIDKKKTAKALVGLSRFRRGMSLTPDETSLIASIEEELVSLKNINYIYQNEYKYLKTVHEQKYILSLNESIFDSLLNDEKSDINKDDLKTNILTMMSMSKDEELQEEFKKEIDTVLLKYIPIAYYKVLYAQKEKTFALSKLISLYQYMLKEDKQSSQSELISYKSINEKETDRKYLNHRKILDEAIFTDINKQIKQTLFSALDGTLADMSHQYYTFYYSYLIELFPHRFITYILRDYKKETNYANLISKFNLAIQLTYKKDILSKKEIADIYKASLYIYKYKSTKFTRAEFEKFSNLISMELAKNRTKKFILASKYILKTKKLKTTLDLFTLNFLYALDLSKAKVTQYTKDFTIILKAHNEPSTQYMSNFLARKDINYLLKLYNNSLFTKDIKLWEISLIGSIINTHKKNIPKRTISKLQNNFINTMHNKDEDKSLLAAHYAKKIGIKNADKIQKTLSKKYPGIKF